MFGPGTDADFGNCMSAPDGDVCLAPEFPNFYDVVAPFNMGVLFLKSGAGDRVRYADYGLFDGTPLPEPSTCPKLSANRICGGNCGGCGANELCHGRSPLHPYGICFSKTTAGCGRNFLKYCTSGEACYLVHVEPSAQKDADEAGRCLPMAACQELVATTELGGAECVKP
jgi:hypothetical protein